MYFLFTFIYSSPWIPCKYYNNLEAAKLESSTQFWAFATTIYEIFSRGQIALERLTQSDLIQNRTIHGGILKPLPQRLCPAEMYDTIMDGWSDDPDKRFCHHDIFTRLNAIKTRLQRNYDVPETETESCIRIKYIFNSLLFINNLLVFYIISDEYADSDDDSNDYPISNGGSNLSNKLPDLKEDVILATLPLVIQLDECKIRYREKHKIGQGHYGTVYRGELQYYNKDRPPEQVAIKKLKAVQVSNDFEREIRIMQSLNHPNIVKFLYWAEKSMSIIMEYFEFGSFLVYLSSRKPDITNNQLEYFALDIARVRFGHTIFIPYH